jgi:hypothetical protein
MFNLALLSTINRLVADYKATSLALAPDDIECGNLELSWVHSPQSNNRSLRQMQVRTSPPSVQKSLCTL